MRTSYVRARMHNIVGAHQNFRFRTCESTGLPVLVHGRSVVFSQFVSYMFMYVIAVFYATLVIGLEDAVTHPL